MGSRLTTSWSTARSMRPAEATAPPWGWLEVVVLSQFLMPGLVYLPGATSWVRTATRVAAFLVPLLAWGVIVASGARATSRRFAAVPWLSFALVWLTFQLGHPETNSWLSGAAEVVLNLAIAAPAFWAARQGAIPARRIGRLLGLIFAVNGASAILGIAQFYWPETFNPPVVPILERNPIRAESYFYEDAGGRKVLRPCGLTDTPGAAGLAGAMACVLGLGRVLMPGPWWRRAGCLAVAGAGLGVIYLSHVRVTLLITLGSVAGLAGLFLLRGEVRRVLGLAVLGAAVGAAGTFWALRQGGTAVADRFATLLERRPDELYQSNRGFYLVSTFTELLPSRPLGAGLGRWGQPYVYFGRPWPADDPRSQIWVEIQWTAWAVDGGVPLVLAALGALGAALVSGLRTVWSCPDRPLAAWAAVTVALNLQVVALCFGALPLVGPLGVSFWLTAAALDAADRQARARRRQGLRSAPLVTCY